jgi:hypothetical protein
LALHALSERAYQMLAVPLRTAPPACMTVAMPAFGKAACSRARLRRCDRWPHPRTLLPVVDSVLVRTRRASWRNQTFHVHLPPPPQPPGLSWARSYTETCHADGAQLDHATWPWLYQLHRLQPGNARRRGILFALPNAAAADGCLQTAAASGARVGPAAVLAAAMPVSHNNAELSRSDAF